MRVRRYIARGTAEELQRGRSGLMSPQEAAAGAAAPFQAAREASEAIAGTALEFERRDRIQQAEEDRLLQKRIVQERKLAFKQWTEKWKDQPEMQDDGTLTSEAMREEWNQINEQFDTRFEMFNDEQTRTNFKEMFDIETSAYQIDTESVISEKREVWARNTAFDLQRMAMETGDYGFANQMSQEMLDKGWISQPQYNQMQGQVEIAKRQNTVDAEMAGMREAYRVGGTSGAEEYVKNRIDNPVADPQDQEAIESALVSQMNQFNAANAAAETREAIAFNEDKARLRILIEQGKAGAAEAEEFFRGVMASGNERAMARAPAWLQELSLAALKDVKTTALNQAFVEGLRMTEETQQTGFIPNTAEMRKNMSLFAADTYPVDASINDKLEIDISYTKGYGVPTERIYNTLKAGANSREPASLIRAARVWNLSRDETGMVTMTDGLEAGERAPIIAVADALMLGGDAAGEAAAQQQIEIADFKRTQPEGVQRAVNESYRQMQTDEVVTDAFDGMIETGYADVRWGPGGESEVFNETLARGRFNQYVYDAVMTTGGRNAEAAVQAATMQFQQDFPVTYINGNAEIQYGGIGGEQSKNTGNLLFDNDLKGKTIQAIVDNERVMVTLEDQDEITFREPYQANGMTHYKVYYGESVAYTEDGTRAVDVVVDDVIQVGSTKTENSSKRVELMEKIDELAKEQMELEPWMFTNPYTKEEALQKQRDIPKQIEYLKAQINELGM